MTVTDTERPVTGNAGEKPAVGGTGSSSAGRQKFEANRNRRRSRPPVWLQGALIATIVVLLVGIVAVVIYFQHEQTVRDHENVRVTAEQALRSRVNDASIQPALVIQKVEWSGNDLVVSYVQGDKSCIAKVKLPEGNSLYGIEPVEKVNPEDRAAKRFYCSTVATSNGLP